MIRMKKSQNQNSSISKLLLDQWGGEEARSRTSIVARESSSPRVGHALGYLPERVFDSTVTCQIGHRGFAHCRARVGQLDILRERVPGNSQAGKPFSYRGDEKTP